MFVLKLIWRNVLYFVNCLLVETTTFVKRSLWVVFHQTDSLQNEQSLPFQSFEVSKQWKVLSFVKRCISLVFTTAGRLQYEQSLDFQVFETSKLWRTSTFFKRCVWLVFSSRQLTKWTKFVFFQVLWNLKVERFENLLLLSKNVCGQFSPRFCTRFSIFKENYAADIIKEHLHVRLLLTSTAKTVVE